MTTAADLGEGRWFARWANWEVRLEGHAGRWSATLSDSALPTATGRSVVVLKQSDFDSATDAATWAANHLKDRGLIVFLLGREGGPPRTLVDILLFEPDMT